jgi:ParB-like chromosome segregation protein Spo0J
MNQSAFEAHPIANLFPMISGRELDDLAADIRESGLLEPIILHEAKILDGRNRYAACEKAGVPIRVREWNGEGGTPLRFVLSHNLHRRHLTTAQRAAVAAEMIPMFEEEARKRQGQRTDIQPPDEFVQRFGRARTEAAGAMDVGESTVSRAKQIKESDPEVFEKLKAGEFRSVEAAHRAAGLVGSDSGRSDPANKEEAAKNGKVPPGPRLNLPDGRTAEEVCREGMAAEADGTTANDVAVMLGLGVSSYRRMKYVVLLSDRTDLSERNAGVVAEALRIMNTYATVGPSFELVEPLVERIYGSGSRSGALERMEEIQSAKFMRAYSALIQTCEALTGVETPHLSPEDAQHRSDELKVATRQIESFRRRFEEANR